MGPTQDPAAPNDEWPGIPGVQARRDPVRVTRALPIALVLHSIDISPDSLPRLPDIGQPAITFEFRSGLRTYLQFGLDTVMFWRPGTRDDTPTRSTLDFDDNDEGFEHLTQEEREAIIAWGKIVHDRARSILINALNQSLSDPIMGGKFAALVQGKLYDTITAESDNATVAGAGRAVRGLSAWTGEEFPVEPLDATKAEVENTVGVLADIRHWCDSRGVSFDDLVKQSEDIWRGEVNSPLL
ncbi:hypothetical protein [Agromyces humi]|uniref:hypothetical protein n=1 Tax=Agromyces humi TaxID=1766800 RepID=UPI001357A463|nr:hypothetical protein [Agromyces humi]